jgi:uncharacterized membrane protein YkvA (DUF1232 family)
MVYAAVPAGTGWLKPVVALLVIYVLSPLDLLPKTKPLLDVVDDLAAVSLAVSFIARRLPSAARADFLRRAS